MGIKLDSKRIFELGEELSNKLREDGIERFSELIINVSKEELRKIDEDLFYRRERDKNEEFIPSDNEININFDKIRIKIQSIS